MRIRLAVLVLCVLLVPPAFAEGARKVALVVGNAAYAGTDRLRNPVADATLTAQSLRQLGFAVTLLTDRNTAQLEGDLNAFAQSAQGADIALFFYAGHGVAVENVNYLVPVDQKVAALTSLGLKRQGTSLRWVESLLTQSKASVAVIVVDACRNALMRGGAAQGMASERAPSGVLTLFSTAPGALARDGNGRNSEFSEAFNRYLPRQDLSLKQIAELTQRDVSAATEATQVPWINSGLVGDVNLASARVLPRGSTPRLPPAATASRGAGEGGEAQRTAFWNENLARLDEELTHAVQTFDVNSRPLLEQRAAAGDVMAASILGAVYSGSASQQISLQRAAVGVNGQIGSPEGGVAPDPQRALRYLRPAAAKRFPVAQTLLAELLVEGRKGIPRDLQKAANLLEDAAATGYGRARMDLLDLKARQGRVTPADLINNAETLRQYIQRFGQPAR